MSSLIFHYQPVQHTMKDIFLHEAFSTRTGILYSVNPLPFEPNGESEEEVAEVLQAMKLDNEKHKPVNYSKISREMERWVDEVEITQEVPVPTYEDEEVIEADYYDNEDKVLDLVDYMKKNS